MTRKPRTKPRLRPPPFIGPLTRFREREARKKLHALTANIFDGQDTTGTHIRKRKMARIVNDYLAQHYPNGFANGAGHFEAYRHKEAGNIQNMFRHKRTKQRLKNIYNLQK